MRGGRGQVVVFPSSDGDDDDGDGGGEVEECEEMRSSICGAWAKAQRVRARLMVWLRRPWSGVSCRRSCRWRAERRGSWIVWSMMESKTAFGWVSDVEMARAAAIRRGSSREEIVPEMADSRAWSESGHLY